MIYRCPLCSSLLHLDEHDQLTCISSVDHPPYTISREEYNQAWESFDAGYAENNRQATDALIGNLLAGLHVSREEIDKQLKKWEVDLGPENQQ